MTGPISVTPLADGAWWRVTLGGSKGNILTGALMSALTAVFHDASRTPGLKAVLLEGAGDHFSFGASVQEHLPAEVEGMLRSFRDLLVAEIESSVVVVSAVRGQCLGGALELVTPSHRIFAERDAKFGQPEIRLGVFAPAASVLLPRRIGRAHAEDLCLTGRTIGAGEAFTMGLVDEVTDDDPVALALEWLGRHLAPLSASSLRLAVRAIRADLLAALHADLPRVEHLYLSELMKTADASEGLRAFLDKRRPHWRHA